MQHVLDTGFALRVVRAPSHVEAGTENGASAPNDGDALLRLGRDLEDGLQVFHHFAVESIALLGPVQRDGAHRAFYFPFDFGHPNLP